MNASGGSFGPVPYISRTDGYIDVGDFMLVTFFGFGDVISILGHFLDVCALRFC